MELDILAWTKKWVTIRAIHAYLGFIGCDGVEYIDKDRKRVKSRAIHAYLGCIGCDGVEYIDKDEEEGDE
jgi:hypothetical protein